MFTELSEELLDLAVHEQGYRHALYAKLLHRLVLEPHVLQDALVGGRVRRRRWGA